MKKILLLFLLLPASGLQAQNHPFSLRISLGNEATAIPFTRFLSTPVHPHIQIGTEFDCKEFEHFRLYSAMNAGYIYHRHLYQGVHVNGELGLDYKTPFGLNLKSALGLGYLRTYTTRQEYQFRNGRYERGRDSGNSRIMPSVSLGTGYRLPSSSGRSPELFIMYQIWLEYPYSPGFIPLMSHATLRFGYKFYPFKNRKI